MTTAVATPDTAAGPVAGAENDNKDSISLERISSEVDDREVSLERYEILSYPADYTLEVLVSKWHKGEIVIPSFQRRFVWKKTQASKLIESFLMGLPVPPIYVFSDIGSDKLLVVDGQQRIQSIAYYFEGYFGSGQNGKRNVFRLNGLDESSPYNGLTYEELQHRNPSAFAKLNNSILRAFIIQQLDPADDTSIYHVFERLNTGGTQLSTQEIRNCVHHGSFNDMLVKINEYEPWRVILGKPDPDNQLRDVELILRFLALNQDIENYRKPMKYFLNKFISTYNNMDTKRLEEFEKIFKKTVDIVIDKLGEKPFHISSGLNVAVFDSVFVTIAQLTTVPVDLQQQYHKLIHDKSFLDCIRARTTDKEIVLRRMRMAADFLR